MSEEKPRHFLKDSDHSSPEAEGETGSVTFSNPPTKVLLPETDVKPAVAIATGFKPSGLTIRKRLILGIAIIICLLLMGSGISIWQLSRLNQAVIALEEETDRVSAALQLRLTIAEATSTSNTWRVIDDEDVVILTSFVTTTKNRLDEEHASFKSAIGDPAANDPIRPVLDDIEVLLASLQSNLDRLSKQAQVGRWEEIEFYVKETLPRGSDLLVKVMDRILVEAGSKQASAAARVIFARRGSALSALLAIGLALIVTVVTAWSTVRSITGPVERLVEGTTHVAAGHMEERIPIKKKDEIGHLAVAFNQMMDELQTRTDELATFNKQLQQEITERKQIEETLRKYEHIVSSSSDLMSFIDRDYVYQAVNEFYFKAHQKEYAEIVGHSVVDLHGSEVFNKVIKSELDRCLAGEEIRFQEWFDYPGMGRRFMDVIYTPYFDASGEASGVVVNIRDITERKLAEEALRESEERYRLLVENANDAIFIIKDGIVKFHNFKTEEMTGYSEKELSEIPFANIIHPDDREMVLERRRKRLLGEKPPSTYSFRMIHKSGGELLVQINTVLITWEEKPATINFIRDITEQKRLEAKLQQAQKMESVGLLAGGVAHDLNNVLSGIVSYPELLLLDLPEDSKLRKPIETMQESGHRAAAIVQDLLTVARGVATTKEPLNLNDLVSDYLNSPEFNKLKQFHPTVKIKINLDSNLLNITGSYVHIRKVIMNLVSNASESIEGSGNIIISTKNRYLDRPLKGYDDITIGEYAVLAVSDDGSGILPGDLEKIFDPFYTKKVLGRSGTGLGLAVVWNVLQDHVGYIDVKSDENGTIFELYFSITRDEISDKALSIPIKDYKGDGERILVVDDVESQQEISCKMLDTLGYKAQAISSGEEAIEYLKENTVDLILLDMIMDPGINGRETYERIIKIHPKQKAIIVSGFAETDDVKETQKLGAGQYVKKPLTLEMLGIAVKDALRK